MKKVFVKGFAMIAAAALFVACESKQPEAVVEETPVEETAEVIEEVVPAADAPVVEGEVAPAADATTAPAADATTAPAADAAPAQ